VAGVLAFTETQAWIDSGPFGKALSQPVQRGESKCSRWARRSPTRKRIAGRHGRAGPGRGRGSFMPGTMALCPRTRVVRDRGAPGYMGIIVVRGSDLLRFPDEIERVGTCVRFGRTSTGPEPTRKSDLTRVRGLEVQSPRVRRRVTLARFPANQARLHWRKHQRKP
jgi:hypothetical protein